MRISPLLAITVLFIAGITVARADDKQALALQAVAATDSTEVHPDDVFDLTLSLKNLTGVTQTIKIPECGWDKVWRSSNRRVTWDFWDCDADNQITIEIAPHDTYIFPKPLKMFVNGDVEKETHMDFRMGYRSKSFGKTLWSAPVTLDVIP